MIQYRPVRFRRVAAWWVAPASWLLMTQAAIAQAPTSGGESQEAWVTSYALVILCVGLALFVICRPTRRDKRVKKD